MISIEHLISHYMEFADGLPVTLRYPVEPKPKPPVPLITPLKRKSFDISPSKSISPASTSQTIIPAEISKSKWMQSLPSMFRTKKKQIRPSLSKEEKPSNTDAVVNSFRDLSFSSDLVATEISLESYDVPPKKSQDPIDYFTESDKNNAWSQVPMKDNCIEEIYFVDPPLAPFEVEKQEWSQLDVEIYDTQKNLLCEVNQNTGANYYVSMNDLRLDHEIGSGEFGNVLRGFLRLRTGKKIYVAVKTLHKEHYEENLSEFLREASVMIKLDNPYIVKLIGITKGPPLGLVQELLELGSLATFLEDHASEIEESNMVLWASQIASGMEYLESKRFVHRDLAARFVNFLNILSFT
jgi:tyrosine-protein kinase shark